MITIMKIVVGLYISVYKVSGTTKRIRQKREMTKMDKGKLGIKIEEDTRVIWR